MVKGKWIGILAILALTMSACSTAQQAAPTVMVEAPSRPVDLPQSEADVLRVTVQEAKAALENGTAVIVDVRTLEAFKDVHIRGALSIPLTGIEVNPGGVALDKNKWIITYCT